MRHHAIVEWIPEPAVHWTIVPGASGPWAKLVHPDLDEESALARLWEQIGHICRLDETPGGVAEVRSTLRCLEVPRARLVVG